MGQKQAGFLQFEFSYNGTQIEGVLNMKILWLQPSLHIFSRSMYLFENCFKQEWAITISPVRDQSQANRTYVSNIEHFPLQVTHTVYFLGFMEFSTFFGKY